jgi:hypothetical protein
VNDDFGMPSKQKKSAINKSAISNFYPLFVDNLMSRNILLPLNSGKFVAIIADKVMKYNQSTLDKIERVLDEVQYVLRYERGTFQSGYCILEERKVVVLNKFLQLEGRINTLVDIIPQLVINPEMLTPEALKTYEDVLAMRASDESKN